MPPRNARGQAVGPREQSPQEQAQESIQIPSGQSLADRAVPDMAVPPTQAEIDDLAARRHRIALQEVANAEAAQLIQMKHTAAMLAAIERMDSANTGITGSVDQDDVDL